MNHSTRLGLSVVGGLWTALLGAPALWLAIERGPRGEEAPWLWLELLWLAVPMWWWIGSRSGSRVEGGLTAALAAGIGWWLGIGYAILLMVSWPFFQLMELGPQPLGNSGTLTLMSVGIEQLGLVQTVAFWGLLAVAFVVGCLGSRGPWRPEQVYVGLGWPLWLMWSARVGIAAVAALPQLGETVLWGGGVHAVAVGAGLFVGVATLATGINVSWLLTDPRRRFQRLGWVGLVLAGLLLSGMALALLVMEVGRFALSPVILGPIGLVVGLGCGVVFPTKQVLPSGLEAVAETVHLQFWSVVLAVGPGATNFGIVMAVVVVGFLNPDLSGMEDHLWEGLTVQWLPLLTLMLHPGMLVAPALGWWLGRDGGEVVVPAGPSENIETPAASTP